MRQSRGTPAASVVSIPDRIREMALAVAVVTCGVLVGGGPGNAQDQSHADHAQHMMAATSATPTMPGQEVFGTIGEIVRILEADPATDWSKVNINPLREHLIDMDEVTMRAWRPRSR
jgi:uncharacterized protein (DUF1786 family)